MRDKNIKKKIRDSGAFPKNIHVLYGTWIILYIISKKISVLRGHPIEYPYFAWAMD